MIRLLLSSAGGGTCNNLILGLNNARQEFKFIGTNIEASYLAGSGSTINYIIPKVFQEQAYLSEIKKIIQKEKIDLIIANNDLEVPVLAKNRNQLGCISFFPSDKSIALCQDKLAFHEFLKKQNLATPKTFGIRKLEDIETIFSKFNKPEKLWCRIRKGNGSMGALPVGKPEQALFWIKYWNEMRGIPISDFTLSEYLPGRDFAFQSIWKNGKLVIAKTCERIDYLYSRFMPSGTSSTPRVGKLCNIPEVNNTCINAIQSIDPNANGLFSVDLKENQNGEAMITEINIGRFFQISPIFNLTGKHNMAEIFVKLALGEKVDIPVSECFSDIGFEETYLLRDTDRRPVILTKTELEKKYKHQ